MREATLNLLERGLTHIRNVVRSTLVTYRREVAESSLRPVDIDDLRLLIEPEASRKRLRIAWVNDLHGVSPVGVESVRQVVLNLLINACAATPVGGTVHLRARATESWLTIEVGDKAQASLTTLPNTSSDIPMRRPALGAALDFGSCAVSSRTTTERYESFRKSGLSTLIRVTWPFRENLSRFESAKDSVSAEAIHAE